MSRPVLLLATAALAACAARPPERLPATPLGAPTAGVAVAALAFVPADADRDPGPADQRSPFVHDPAVRALYGDVAAATATATAAAPASPAALAPGGDAPPAHEAAGWSPLCFAAAAPRREPFVPAAAFVGAGLGAALSRRGHRGEGALLGAGIGLLFDLQRAVR